MIPLFFNPTKLFLRKLVLNLPTAVSLRVIKITNIFLTKLFSQISERAIIAPPDLPQSCSLKRLELQISSLVEQSLLFFPSLFKASPQLHDFRIKVNFPTMKIKIYGLS